MRMLMAHAQGFTQEMFDAFAELGMEPVFLPGPEAQFYDLDFSDIDAVFCYRFFCYNDISRFPALKYIHTTSHGIDHMPLDYIASHGIVLENARGVYSVPMAEFALGAVLQLYKCSAQLRRQQGARTWRMLETTRELPGRLVTIVGAGSVGTACASRFSAMGCRCVGVCRHPDPDAAFYETQMHIDRLNALLPQTDILLLTVPLTDETRHLMDARRFALLKPGAVLVNIARGPVVDTDAMADALRSGRLFGALADVFEEEPLPADSPLWELENLIITPHSSFIGEGNPQRMFELVYRDTADWLQKQGK